MRAKLKRLHSPDAADLESFAPADPDNFAFLLQLMVGPEHEAGEESFDVQVCTPRWLMTRWGTADVVSLRHHILMARYDYAAMAEALRRMVESCTGSTWPEVAEKVGRIGRWEFEDYSA
ncbi:MAG TPA: immunity 8 family protein [Myxococcaceae bacterium]|nr:immunity 8 family protein [Myxococcaceae bacterium]